MMATGLYPLDSIVLIKLHPFPFKTEQIAIDVHEDYETLKQQLNTMEAPVGYPTFIDISLVRAQTYIFLVETEEFKYLIGERVA